MTGDTLQKNGNINQMMWRIRGRERQAYNFSYDYLDRLRSAVYADVNDAGTVTQSKNFNESLTYADARGNIGTLKRQGTGPSGGCVTFGQIDNLTYTYTAGTNKLTSIAEAVTSTTYKNKGFNPGNGTGTYQYDVNGNMTTDPYKAMNIAYNHLNLPRLFTWTGGSFNGNSVEILYDAAGTKLRKTVKTGATVNYTQDYIGGIEYRGTVREAIYTAEGRYNSGTSRYEYTIKDHLGNARISFTDVNANGTVDFSTDVLQENHYYPFGLNMEGKWVNDAALDNKYQYNGKEWNDDFALNLNDYGARWYDASVGRFLTIDPLVGAYTPYTPYIYTKNNPLKYTDPTGMASQAYNFGTENYEKTIDEMADEQREKANENSQKKKDAKINGKIVNSTKLDAKSLTQITLDVSNIYSDNGIQGDFHFDILTEKDGKALKTNEAGKFDLFIALIDEKDGGYGPDKGNSILDAGANVDGWNGKKWSSFVNIDKIKNYQSKDKLLWEIGYVVAHEFLHQLLQKADYHVNGKSPGSSDYGGHTPLTYPYVNLNTIGTSKRLSDDLNRGRCFNTTSTMIIPEQRILINNFLQQ